MKLLCPIKSGTFRNWTHNVVLKNLDEFFKCQTQGFGGNYDIYKQFGIQGHNGLDIAYENGTEVFASHDGIVSFAGQDSSAGKGVTIDGDGIRTIYWHHLEILVVFGQRVSAGELIAKGDSTGFSTGPHLHYGLKLLDSSGNVLDRDNGYDGAVDATPFLIWYNASMTQEEVRNLYRLAFYREPDAGELTYWSGKALADFLKTAIADRATFLAQT